LTKKAQYKAVYESGITKLDKFVVVRALNNDQSVTRFGYSISKRVGKAVTRNRIRRIFKEIARTLPVRRGVDVVIIARGEVVNADYQKLRLSISKLLKQAGLLSDIDEKGHT
jgi:ribonuclease P protein component